MILKCVPTSVESSAERVVVLKLVKCPDGTIRLDCELEGSRLSDNTLMHFSPSGTYSRAIHVGERFGFKLDAAHRIKESD